MPEERRVSRSDRAWYGMGVVAFGAALAGALDLYRGAFGYDFAAYILAADRLTAGLSPYPTEVVLGPFGQYFYPPLVAALFIPALAAPRVAAGIWMLVLLGVAVAVGWVLVRRHAREDRAWVAAAYVFFPPLVWDLTLGNVTLLSAALAILAWRLRARPAASGALLAASIALKPLAAATVVVWLLAGHARAAAWTAVAGAAAVTLTWPWLGSSWIDYGRVVGAIAASAPGDGSNIIPTALAGAPARALLPVLAVCAATAVALAARRASLPEDHAFRVALAVGPLLSTTLWYTYLIFALPLLLGRGMSAHRWSGWPLRAGRVFAWVLMLAQVIREPGRDFTLPLLGLLALILLGLLPAAAALRLRGPFPNPVPGASVPGLALEGSGRSS